MSAKEMFERLGYKKLPKKYNKNMILYEKEIEGIATMSKKIIYFSPSHKSIQFSPYISYSLEELQAINKQVEELWGDEILKKNGNK